MPKISVGRSYLCGSKDFKYLPTAAQALSVPGNIVTFKVIEGGSNPPEPVRNEIYPNMGHKSPFGVKRE